MDPISHLMEARNRDGIKPARILPAGTKENTAKSDEVGRLLDFFGSIGQNGKVIWLGTCAVLQEKGRMAVNLMQISLGPPPQVSLTLKPLEQSCPEPYRAHRLSSRVL